MFKTDNSLHVFVGPNSTTENAAFQDDVTASAATGSGSIFVVHQDGSAPDGALVAGDLFKVGQKHADGSVNFSPLLKYDDCSIVGKATVARTEQSSVFGWNGTSGSIDAINSNRYTVRVNFKNNVDMYSQQSDLHFFEYVSDASATQLEVADNIVQQMVKAEKFNGLLLGKKRGSVKVSLLSAAAVTEDVAASSGTAAFVNGSKSVTIGNTPAFAVGDYISAAADDATPRYKVVAISGNVATLAIPYAEATETVADGTAKYIAAATMAAAAAGIKITSLEQEWKLGRLTDTQVTFEVSLDGWGATTAVADTAAVKGSGHGKEVAELEWFGKGSQGAPYRTGIISNETDITLYASKDASYDIVEIDGTIADPKYAVAGSGVGRCQIVVALVDDVHQTDGAEANAVFGLTAIFNAA